MVRRIADLAMIRSIRGFCIDIMSRAAHLVSSVSSLTSSRLAERFDNPGRDRVGNTNDAQPIHAIPNSRGTTYRQYARGVGSALPKGPRESLRRRRSKTSITLLAPPPRSEGATTFPQVVALFFQAAEIICRIAAASAGRSGVAFSGRVADKIGAARRHSLRPSAR
jgi:hypothetical protein